LRKPIAFGPFLAAGAVAWMLFGERAIQWYLEFLRSFAAR